MNEKQTVYLSGPMRGRKDFNFPAFDAARDYFLELGYTVISPADLDRKRGFDPKNHDPGDPEAYKAFFSDRVALQQDIDALLRSDIVVLLPGWQESVGASAEEKLARWAGIQVLEYVG